MYKAIPCQSISLFLCSLQSFKTDRAGNLPDGFKLKKSGKTVFNPPNQKDICHSVCLFIQSSKFFCRGSPWCADGLRLKKLDSGKLNLVLREINSEGLCKSFDMKHISCNFLCSNKH